MICSPVRSPVSPKTSSAAKRLPVSWLAAQATASASTAPPARTKHRAAASADRLTIRSLQPG
eukprot:15408908-Alexandrium_andersonii.AAC.1